MAVGLASRRGGPWAPSDCLVLCFHSISQGTMLVPCMLDTCELHSFSCAFVLKNPRQWGAKGEGQDCDSCLKNS